MSEDPTLEDLFWRDLSKENPCKTKKKEVCDDLNTLGLSCSLRKTANKKSCVSNRGKKTTNEQSFMEKMTPKIYAALQSKRPVDDLMYFREMLQYAFEIARNMKVESSKRHFILMIYHFYIVNAHHWSFSPKVAASLLDQCEKNVPKMWFEGGEKKELRRRICSELQRLAKKVMHDKTSACSANFEDHFDFEQACYLDMISGECLEKKVVVNQNRKTEKGIHTECYNPSSAKKLQVDPMTREPFKHLTMDRPSIVDPIQSCTKTMSKKQCEAYCRRRGYSGATMERCLIPNKYWKNEITIFQNVKNLLQYVL